MDHRSDVREFLSTRRDRITPEHAGLPAYGGNRRVLRLGLYLLALILLASMAFGIFHAGVEWRFWEGPTTCAAGPPSAAPVDRNSLATRLRSASMRR